MVVLCLGSKVFKVLEKIAVWVQITASLRLEDVYSHGDNKQAVKVECRGIQETTKTMGFKWETNRSVWCESPVACGSVQVSFDFDFYILFAADEQENTGFNLHLLRLKKTELGHLKFEMKIIEICKKLFLRYVENRMQRK